MSKTKAAVAAVVALAAAYAGSSWWAGRRIEQGLHAQQARLQAQWPFKVAHQRYERGWWTSTRTTIYEFGCLPASPDEQARQPLRLTVVDRIQHGPLPGGRRLGAAYIETQPQWGAQAERAAAQFFGHGQPLVVATRVAFDGALHSLITSAPGQMRGEQGERVVWEGLHGEVRTNAAGTEVRYDLRLPGLEVRVPRQQGLLSIKDLRLHGDGKVPAGGSWWLMTGRGEGELAALEFEAGTPVQPAADGRPATSVRASLAQMKFASDTRIEQDLLTSTTTLTGRGRIGDTPLDKLEMQASLKRLHAPTYHKLVAALVQAGVGCGDEAEDGAARVVAMHEHLLQLLPHEPEYALDKLAVEYGGRRGELSYALGVRGITAGDLQRPLPEVLMAKAQLRADVRLPVAWLHQLSDQPMVRRAGTPPDARSLELMLDEWADQGLLVRQGEHVAGSVRYDAGQLTLNGRPLPIGPAFAPR